MKRTVRPPRALIVDDNIARAAQIQMLPALAALDPVAIPTGREVAPMILFLSPAVIVAIGVTDHDVETIRSYATESSVVVRDDDPDIDDLNLALENVAREWKRDTSQPRNSARQLVKLGSAVIDLARGCVIRGSSSIPLAPCEQALFGALLRRAGQSVSRETLLDEVWNGKQTSSRVVDRQVFLLRQRIEENPKRPRFIKTVFEEGYRLDLAG